MESIYIEVKPECSEFFFIVAWYRPPKYETQTVIEMETLLNARDNENKEIMLIGDINCDDLPVDEKSTMIRKLRDLCRVYQMKLIKEPTRSTLTTATIIDPFATNKPNLIISSGLFATVFSDYDMIFSIRKVSSQVKRSATILDTYTSIFFKLNLHNVHF